MFLPSVLPHPDAVGVGVARGGTCCHGAVASRVFRYCAGIGQVSWRGFRQATEPAAWHFTAKLKFKSNTMCIKCPEWSLHVCFSTVKCSLTSFHILNFFVLGFLGEQFGRKLPGSRLSCPAFPTSFFFFFQCWLYWVKLQLPVHKALKP